MNIPVSIAQLASWLNVKPLLPKDSIVHQISTDSRNITPGCIFIALKGPNFDGIHFVQHALDQGASAAIVTKETFYSFPNSLQNKLLPVDDTLLAYGDIAKYYLTELKAKIIAITGSAGKTTTKEKIKSILQKSYSVVATEKNFNNRIGVPLTALRCSKETDYLILEMGMNIPGEIESLCHIAPPDYALITNIGESHIANFHSKDDIAYEKGAVFRKLKSTGTAFINIDDDKIIKLRNSTILNEVTYSIKSTSANAYLTSSKKIRNISLNTLQLNNKSITYHSQILSQSLYINDLAAATLTHHIGASSKDIIFGLQNSNNIHLRMERKKTHLDQELLIDCYNANPTAMTLAIETLHEISEGKSSCAILGDMLELGEGSNNFHLLIGESLTRYGIDCLVSIGNFRNQMGLRFNGTQHQFPTTESALSQINEITKHYKTLLIKGSRGMHLEKLLPKITHKDK